MAPDLVVNIGRHPHSEALFEQPPMLPDGTLLKVEEGAKAGSTDAMLQHLAYDIAELPLVNYIAAKELGLEATAIAVFPTRRFVQWMIEVPEESAISEPRDLEGKRIVCIHYGNTDSVWARGVLAEDYGVDLSNVTWVTVRPERIRGERTPNDIELIPGTHQNDLLASRAVDAKIGNGYGGPAPYARTLWRDPERAAEEWFESSKCFPVLHAIVVRDAALDAHENLASDLYDIFDAAKRTALIKADFGRRLSSSERIDALQSGFAGAAFGDSDRHYLGEDPIPYGLDANRDVLERLIRYSAAQGTTQSMHEIEELFVSTKA